MIEWRNSLDREGLKPSPPLQKPPKSRHVERMRNISCACLWGFFVLLKTLRNNHAETLQNMEAGDHKGLPYIELSKEYRRGGTSVYARPRCKEHHTTTNQ